MTNFFDHPQFDRHEHINIFHDRESGLNAIIVIHKKGQQFAVGGTRMKKYTCLDDALGDALRLSKAMTYKLALANIPLGGGKSVIIADPQKDKSPELFAAFGSFVDCLGGTYCCAPDVGTSAKDMLDIRKATPYVRGIQDETGDSSLDTALGVFHAIRAAAKYQLARDKLEDVKIAIQGVGNVGRQLHRLLIGEGALLTVADSNSEQTSALAREPRTRIVDTNEILFQDVDIFAPCALGNVISKDVIDKMSARIICGAANNQLCNIDIAEDIARRGILYVPDYLANAGGVIGGCRIDCNYSKQEALTRIEEIYDTCLEIFRRSEQESQSTSVITNALAESRMNGFS